MHQVAVGKPRTDLLEMVEIDGIKLRLKPHYSAHMVSVLKAGNYEVAERNIVKQILQPGDRIIEVGSAVGFISMLCARQIGADNIRAFDANPILVNDARENCVLNGLSGIDFRNGVLQNNINWSGRGSTSTFHLDADFWASSLKPTATTVDHVEVESFCLEKEIIESGANVLVCDIEGGETELLTLADLGGIKKILLEIHIGQAGRYNIYQLIRKLNLEGFQTDFDLSNSHVLAMHRGLLAPWY